MKQKKSINDFGRKGWGIVIYVLFLFWISAGAVDLLNVSVDSFVAIKGWDGNQLLIFSSLGNWAGIIVSILVGIWVVKKGVRIPTFVALIILGILFILNGIVGSVAGYGIVIVLLSAFSTTINLISTNTYMSNWFPRKKGIALGWSSMGMCMSSVISIPIFAMLLSYTGSLVMPYMFFGVASIIIGIITALVVKPMPEDAGAFPDNEPEGLDELSRNRDEMESYQSPWTIPKLLRTKQVWLISVAFGFLFIGVVATMTQFVPRFMAAGFTQAEAIKWLSIAGVLGIFGSYLWGLLDQKTNTRFASIIYAAYLLAIQFLNAIFFDNQMISMVLIVLIGILIGGIGNLFPSMVIQVFGRYDFAAANRICVPILTAIRACTFLIIPIVLGATMGNYRILCVVLGVIGVIALILLLALNNKTIGKVNEKSVVFDT